MLINQRPALKGRCQLIFENLNINQLFTEFTEISDVVFILKGKRECHCD